LRCLSMCFTRGNRLGNLSITAKNAFLKKNGRGDEKQSATVTVAF